MVSLSQNVNSTSYGFKEVIFIYVFRKTISTCIVDAHLYLYSY